MDKENTVKINKLLAWHFLPKEGHLSYDKNIFPKDDELLKIERPGYIKLCNYGYHASEKILDALSFRKGTLLCRVELSGHIIKGDDKVVASERKILWRLDCEKLLRKFAVGCAMGACEKTEVQEIIDFITYINLRYEENDWTSGITDEEYRAADRAAYYAAEEALQKNHLIYLIEQEVDSFE